MRQGSLVMMENRTDGPILVNLMNRIAPDTVQTLLGIDVELVCAFAADWSERIGAYGE